MRLSHVQRSAIRAGSPRQWLGARETGVQGNTMVALEQRGLADVREQRRPYRRLVFRLTDAGNALRVDWAIDSATQPVEHTPIRVRCTHCGATAADGTPGGSCHECGLTVEEVCPDCEDGFVILNPEWPAGTRPHREHCGSCGGTGIRSE